MFARASWLLLPLTACATTTPVPAPISEPAPVSISATEPEPEPASNSAPSPAPSPSPSTAPEYSTPLLDAPALADAARAACESSLSSGRPLLLEFSAPWCEDCVVLERLKGAEPLAHELDAWELFPINIGGGFEHPALMRAYRVNAIAKLVSVHPRKCSDPLTTWVQGSARTLDGITRHKDRAGATLADWLRAERERVTRARGTY